MEGRLQLLLSCHFGDLLNGSWIIQWLLSSV